MATTTNYGWTTPDNTDLVKDGALAIRTLGSAVDATVFANAGAGIAKTIVDAQGDIIAGTAADTVARLAVGANDTVLTADSSTATGLKWAAPASGGGMTLLQSGTLSGSTTTLSSIPGTYVNLFLVINDYYPSTSSAYTVRCNGISSGYGLGMNMFNVGVGGMDDDGFGSGNQIAAADNNNVLTFQVFDYANTNAKKLAILFDHFVGTTQTMFMTGIIPTASAVNEISIILNAGTWSAGSYKLYGVK
jgi:hypothetical protein